MKLLLYCTKAKPYLFKNPTNIRNQFIRDYWYANKLDEKPFDEDILNGKILAECDFEVEEIRKANYDCILFTNTLDTEKLINKSCIDYFKLEEYLKPNWDKEDDLQNLDTVGYAIHIKNLQIFDKPRELYDCLIHPKIEPKYYGCEHLSKAPQNMMYVELDDIRHILISIKPEWLCKILNGEKTIEIRKKVLKEMIK